MTASNQTDGWTLIHDLRNQCAQCYWVLIQHQMGCCEFDRAGFPSATNCAGFRKFDSQTNVVEVA
jgi:hypothetical protein